MKRVNILLTLLIALSLALASCSTSNSMSAGDNANLKEEANFDYSYTTDNESTVDSATGTSKPENDLASRKIIKNANMEVQTKTFDAFVQSLNERIASLGGFIQSSSIRGNSYNSSANRNAHITARIPAEKLEQFKTDVSGLANVIYYNETLRDVTMSYVDTESHVKALRAEQEALLNLLAKADHIDAIIQIQTRLTEVNYQIESYESQLRTYDDLISYSTVEINVYEVEKITVVEEQNTWQKIATGFVNNTKDIFDGAETFFVWFVSSVPYMIIIAAIVVVIVILIRRKIKKNKQKLIQNNPQQ